MEPCVISSLPVELLDSITAQIHRRDLLALRLTCRRLAATTRDQFGAAFFSRRHQIFSLASLQTLVDITASRTLGKHIREIEISSVHFYRPDFHTSIHGHPLDIEAATAYAINLYIEKKLWHILHPAETHHLRLMVQILRNLQTAQCTPRLSVSVYERGSESAPYGFRSLLGSFLPLVKPGPPRRGASERAVRSMLWAVIVTGFPVEYLSLSAGRHNGAYSPAEVAFAMPPVIKRSIPHVFHHLRALHIQVPHIDYQNKVNLRVREIFGHVSTLEELSIASNFFVHLSASDLCPVLAGTFSKCRLRTLIIRDVNTTANFLWILLDYFKTSLQNVRLVSVALGYITDWPRILAQMRDMLRLQRLELKYMAEFQNRLFAASISTGEAVEVDVSGIEEVHRWLDRTCVDINPSPISITPEHAVPTWPYETLTDYDLNKIWAE